MPPLMRPPGGDCDTRVASPILSRSEEAECCDMRPQNTGSAIDACAPVHHGVVANEFKPGHPVVFWFFIVVLIFGFVSGTKALITIDTCKTPTSDVKHWRVMPPEWVCSAGRFEWSR